MGESEELVVITARWLADGAPVYLTAKGEWSRDFQQSKVFPAEAGEAEAAKRGQSDQPLVADPYTFKIERRDGSLDALSTRERIRSTGPTTPLRRPDRAST
ncbi:MAG TPA: DUF2849 domain-containing protein [Polyangiales bacterium]|nr:DUF2849 domain-containing protein [Polyangiales bacterium]